MSLQILLSSFRLFQIAALALSVFNLTAFLWLALTVWLNGNRRAGIVRLGVIGLGLSALFFFIHAILIASPLTPAQSFFSLDFWWRMIWLPALGVPYLWFAIGLHYAALINKRWRGRRPFLLLLSAALGLGIFLLLIFNRNVFTYAGALRPLTSGPAGQDTQHSLLSPLLLIPILFLIYVTFCAIGPWFTIGRVNRLFKILWRVVLPGQRSKLRRAGSLRRLLLDAFWDDPLDMELLEEPMLSWHLARPGLLLAALLMVGLTTTLGGLVVQSMINWLGYGQHLPSTLPSTVLLDNSFVPFNLLILDVLATGAVAVVILLIGYSIVRHGVLIERPLARRGFFEQWRGIVIVATLVALLIAALVTWTQSSLGGLLLITSLATAAYALFTWSSYTAHDRYIALLGPFVRSSAPRHWLNTDLSKTEQDLEYLFFHLCYDVLDVQCASLAVLTGSVRRAFSYRWPANLALASLWEKTPRRASGKLVERSDSMSPMLAAQARRVQVTVNDQPLIIWILPVYNERGLAATLYLGPRQDGGAFTDEDMNLAHACGQRILDTLGDHEAMQAVASLLRRRVVDIKLLGAQQRRILHDEILPQMHLALLRLEMLRSLPAESRRESGGQAVDEAIAMISDAHRRLAAMMRATAPGAPHRLEHEGLINAIQTMLEQDFQNAFDEVIWRVSEETAASIDEIVSPAIAELIFAAVQEALRNAARHARGVDVHRALRLIFSATWSLADAQLLITVADNGVGLASADDSTTGTGGGLLTHSALLAIAGGSLVVKSAPGEGVTVLITLPATALR